MTKIQYNKEPKTRTKKGVRDTQSFFTPITVQKKLEIGAEDDHFEVEADRIADQVVRMSDSQVQPHTASQTSALIQRKCAACEEEHIQKKLSLIHI